MREVLMDIGGVNPEPTSNESPIYQAPVATQEQAPEIEFSFTVEELVNRYNQFLQTLHREK